MKKILSIILAVIMALLFVSCGKGADKWQKQYDEGINFMYELEFDSALRAFDAAIETDPANPQAYVAKAGIYYACGNSTEALGEMEKAISATGETETLLQLKDHIVTRRYEPVPALDRVTAECSVVKTVTEDGYYGGKQIVGYNAKNKPATIKNMDANGEFMTYSVFTYEESEYGELETYYNEDGTCSNYIEYDYDPDGNVLSKRKFQAGGVYKGSVWTIYDINDLRIDTEYDANSVVISEIEYNEKEQPVKYTSYENGVIVAYGLYEYSEDGLTRIATTYRPSGESIGSTKTAFNSNGTVREMINYRADGSISYKVDADGYHRY